MKKMILTMLGLSIILMAGSLEENIKSCDNGDVRGCLDLSRLYMEGDRSNYYKFYQTNRKIFNLAHDGCKKGNKKLCKLETGISALIKDGAPFMVDDIYAGMAGFRFMEQKFDMKDLKNLNVKIEQISPLLSQMKYGGKISGEAINYETNILGKRVLGKVFLTAEGKGVYALILEWDNDAMSGGMETADAVKKSLIDKYGEGVAIDKKTLSKLNCLKGMKWNPNNRTTIFYYLTMNAQMGFRTLITYTDSEFFQQNLEELAKPKQTNKL